MHLLQPSWPVGATQTPGLRHGERFPARRPDPECCRWRLPGLAAGSRKIPAGWQRRWLAIAPADKPPDGPRCGWDERQNWRPGIAASVQQRPGLAATAPSFRPLAGWHGVTPPAAAYPNSVFHLLVLAHCLYHLSDDFRLFNSRIVGRDAIRHRRAGWRHSNRSGAGLFLSHDPAQSPGNLIGGVAGARRYPGFFGILQVGQCGSEGRAADCAGVCARRLLRRLLGPAPFGNRPAKNSGRTDGPDWAAFPAGQITNRQRSKGQSIPSREPTAKFVECSVLSLLVDKISE